MPKTIKEYLTYDDVLLLPHYSEVLPSQADPSTQLTKRLRLTMPIVSAAMDTVTEKEMATAMAKNGGLGVIHKNLTPAEQAAHVTAVKQAGKQDKNAKSTNGSFVAAAVGPNDDERVSLLHKAGVDAIVVDTAHGHSKGVVDAVKRYRKQFGSPEGSFDIIAGNVATAEGASALASAGADVVKVGIGPGAICTTRIVTGVGVPQLSAVMECVDALGSKSGVSVIADGGIRYSGDACKALAAGARAVMLGGMLAGTTEAPGSVQTIDGKQFKTYRGMGSLEAMVAGGKTRYGQSDVKQSDKLVPEGVGGLVPYKGPVDKILYQMTGGLRSSMGYLGAKTLPEYRANARFVRLTSAGMTESHPHTLSRVYAAPNYPDARE